METLKAAPTKVTLITDRHQVPEKDKYDNFLSHVEFASGSSGQFRHKEEDQTFFVVGKEVEFTFEKNQYGTLLKKPTKPNPYTGGGGGRGYSKSPADYKRECVGYAAGYVKDLVVAGKLERQDFAIMLSEVVEAMKTEIDNIS